MKYIDPDKLQPGDIVGITDLSWFACVERTTINGLGNVFNQMLSTHIAVVCDRGSGLLYFCEMMYPTIQMNNLQEYDHLKPMEHITFVGRHPALAADGGKRMACNDFLIESHAHLVKYDLLELLKFWDMPVPDDPKKIICSDLPRNMLRAVGLPYPMAWDVKCSPYDWQVWNTLIHVSIAPCVPVVGGVS
jgi:hypothetical protein